MVHSCMHYTAATSIDFPTGTLTPCCMHVPESAILVAITEISVLESISAGGKKHLLESNGTVKKIVVALSTRQKLLVEVSLYVRHFCPCNNTYQLIFHQLIERRAGISANSNYHGNSHSCEHSKCKNFCCSFPPTTNYVDNTVSAAASRSKI